MVLAGFYPGGSFPPQTNGIRSIESVESHYSKPLNYSHLAITGHKLIDRLIFCINYLPCNPCSDLTNPATFVGP